MKKIFLYCLPFCLLFASCSDLLDEESLLGDRQGQLPEQRQEGRKRFFRAFTRIWRTSTPIRTTCRCCSRSRPTSPSAREFDDFVPRDSDQLHNASTSQISRTWQQLYSAIYDANGFIETVSDRMDGWGSSDRELAAIYLGEARALRALFYFELVRWYGNVVLMTSTADSRKKDEDYRAVRRGGCLRLYRRGPEIRRRRASLGR